MNSAFSRQHTGGDIGSDIGSDSKDEAPTIRALPTRPSAGIDSGAGSAESCGHGLSRSPFEHPEHLVDSQWQLKAALALQKSLDPGDLLDDFSSLLNERVLHSGVRVRASLSARDRIVDLTIGRPGKYSCSFHIDSHPSGNQRTSITYIEGDHSKERSTEKAEERLGDILFFRDVPFSTAEKKEIAHVLPLIEYPLRNTLLHEKALRGMFKDPLTGSYNRAMMEEILISDIENAAREGTPLSLMMIDIDDFKSVNDRFGHLAGDGILVAFAKRIQGAIRKKDRLFRYGGDEFVIVAGNTDFDGIRRIEKRLRRVIGDAGFDIFDFDSDFDNAFDGSQNPISLGAGFGIAKYRPGDCALDLISRADEDLYLKKRKKKKPSPSP